MPTFLSTQDPGFETAFAALLSAKREDAPDVDAAVVVPRAPLRRAGPTILTAARSPNTSRPCRSLPGRERGKFSMDIGGNFGCTRRSSPMSGPVGIRRLSI